MREISHDTKDAPVILDESDIIATPTADKDNDAVKLAIGYYVRYDPPFLELDVVEHLHANPDLLGRIMHESGIAIGDKTAGRADRLTRLTQLVLNKRGVLDEFRLREAKAKQTSGPVRPTSEYIAPSRSVNPARYPRKNNGVNRNNYPSTYRARP